MGYSDLDAEDLVNRAFSQHRGPMPGDGRGPGQPWAGVVEKTPALWVTWITDAAKRVDRDPAKLQVSWYETPLEMEAVQMTFGPRWYWRCPRCHRRCEAVYKLGPVGCRECLRLGYKSQMHRPGSSWYWLDQIFARDWVWQRGRWLPDNEVAKFIVKDLGGHFRAQVDEMLAALELAEADK